MSSEIKTLRKLPSCPSSFIDNRKHDIGRDDEILTGLEKKTVTLTVRYNKVHGTRCVHAEFTALKV